MPQRGGKTPEEADPTAIRDPFAVALGAIPPHARVAGEDDPEDKGSLNDATLTSHWERWPREPVDDRAGAVGSAGQTALQPGERRQFPRVFHAERSTAVPQRVKGSNRRRRK